MSEYDIVHPIVLGFLTHNDSYSMTIMSESGHLKFDGHDIVFVDSKGKELISHTTNNAIDIWLEQGSIIQKHFGVGE